MAKLNFDSLPEVGSAEAPPSVPISAVGDAKRAPPQELPAAPAPPISQPGLNPEEYAKARAFDRGHGLNFDDLPDATEAQQSVARVREIASKARGGSFPPGPLDYIADAATLSTSRPISAAITAGVSGLTGSYPGSSYGERYKGLLQAMNERIAQAEKNTGPIAPIVGTLAQLPVNMATGGSAAVPASTAKVALRSAGQGFVEGAAQNADSVDSAVKGGATNAILSGGTTAALDKGMKAVMPAARRAADAEATAARGATPDDIKASTKQLYNQLDNNGIAYDAQQTAPLYVALQDMRTRAQYSPNAHPTLVDYFDQLQTLTRQGASFNQLHDLRSAISGQARGSDPDTRRAAGQILGEIDRLVTGTKPAINPNNVDVATVYPEATKLWRAASLADDAGWVADKTERKMAVKSGVNPDETTRQNFAAVEQRIDKPGAYDPFDPEGRKLLSQIIRGGTIQNAQSAVGDTLRGPVARFAGGAAGLAAPLAVGWSRNSDPLLTTLLSAAGGATAAGGVNSVGKMFQGAAANRGQDNVNALLRHITGSAPPVPGAAIDRGDLAKIIFAQDLERLAPRVGSQMIGTRREEQE